MTYMTYNDFMLNPKLKFIDSEEALAEDLKDPEFRKIWEEGEVERQINFAILDKRMKSKITQKQLADRIGTDQATLSRLESGKMNPSINFLKRVAKALDKKLVVKFV